MAHRYLLDTNVLLFDPLAILHYDGADVILPLEVIEEIDTFKHDPNELGRSSRAVAHLIDDLRRRGSVGNGVLLDNGGRLRVLCEIPAPDDRQGFPETRPDNRVGNSILAAALYLRRTTPAEPVTIVTKNVNLRVKADALGIEATDYDPERIKDVDTIRGWHSVDVDAPLVEALRAGRSIVLPELDTAPNEYVFVRRQGNPKVAQVGRVHRDGRTIWPLGDTTRPVCGIRSLNVQQTFCLDALLDAAIPMVTLAGKAGTGKTLLAMAAGLHQVFSDNRYQRLTVFRPTIAVSRDLGYLPGDLGEKMKPWMQPVYDALELIRSQDRKCPTRSLPGDVLECEEISVEPLTYIRGRSIPNQFIVIDEAQNLTPLEVKTVITRVGAGSKVVLTGDPHQIDNPYVDARSNGLTRLVDRFRDSPLSAHVTLVQGERSELAETAANIL
ncbi:MAG: PhoH family protein [Lentisphaeria bacterium]|nr:PhoH family protein [Lentisphaeria bacterium]